MAGPGKLARALADNLRSLRPRRHNLPHDAASGLTQALAMVPEGMAAAVLARVSPIYGLHAVMFGPVVGALFTGSMFMCVTTTGSLAVGAREALAANRGRPVSSP